MPNNTFYAALVFLINTLFDIYLFILVIRLILVWVGAEYFNPFVQFIVRFTDFIIKPMRRVIPNIGRLETSTLILILLLEVIKMLLLLTVTVGMPNILGILILAFGDTLKLFIQTFFYAILFQAILSWIQPGSPLNRLLYQVTAPIMQPMQRIIPPIGGIDISPIPALIILQLLLIILVNPIMAFGSGVAFGVY